MNNVLFPELLPRKITTDTVTGSNIFRKKSYLNFFSYVILILLIFIITALEKQLTANRNFICHFEIKLIKWRKQQQLLGGEFCKHLRAFGGNKVYRTANI